MKRIVIRMLSLSLIIISVLSGPALTENASDKLRVVTTIFPPYDFVREIAGDSVDLSMLLHPGSESHSFEPTPQDILSIQNCDVFIYVGGESDTWVDRILSSMDTGNMTVISLLSCVQAVEEEIVEGMQAEDWHEEDEASTDAEDTPEYDEHVWTSPKNAMAIVDKIAEVLCALDDPNAGQYQENASSYRESLAALDLGFEAALADAVRTTLVFGDRFPFRYLADAYGLTYYAAFPGCSNETEASAATIAFLIDKVREEEIPVVFHIEFSNEKIAKVICESTNAVTLQLHSCHNMTREDFENGVTYLELMWRNVEALKEALQ